MTSSPFSIQTSGDLTADRRYAYGDDAYRAGDFIAARDLFIQTLERVPNWPPAFLGLGKAQLALDALQDAQAAFEAVLAHDPEDRLGAGLYLARLAQGRFTPHTMSDPFISGLFDAYAPRFDDHLTRALGYSAPALLKSALDQAGFVHAHLALDLGCGTGLMGAELRPQVDRLIGVDLSPLMLAKAAEKALYDALHCLSIQDYLETKGDGPFDLVLAADVFCYIGALMPIFDALRGRMQAGGVLAFTIQTHDGPGIILGDDLRFHHAPKAVMDELIKAGFTILQERAIAARLDRGKPVPGHLFCATCS
jgi:predicted TPR repeat methyltransferase